MKALRSTLKPAALCQLLRSITGSLSRAIRQIKKETAVAYAIAVVSGSKGLLTLSCVILLAIGETCGY